MQPHVEADQEVSQFADSDVNDQTRAQLRVIREIDTVLSSLHMRFWLRGGWAIDFLLGQVTRPHADIDLVTWLRHRRRMQRALTGAGFQLVRETEVQSDFLKGDQDISFVFLTRADDAAIVAHGIPGWTWRADALPLRRFGLHDLSVSVVSPQQLLEEKEGYERGTGRTLRPKDLESLEVLRSIMGAR